MRVKSSPAGEAFASRVAAEVRAEMARQGVTQQALADRLGWPQSRLSRRIALEGGKHKASPFDMRELGDVADALGVSVMRLIPVEVPV